MPAIGWVILATIAFSSIWGVNSINSANKQEFVTEPPTSSIDQKEISPNSLDLKPSVSADPKPNKEESSKKSEAQPSRIPSAAPAKSENTSCHPSYSGCLKSDASDYDCSGGSGNGPYYTGPVKVYGPDVFDLDRDNDGVACE